MIGNVPAYLVGARDTQRGDFSAAFSGNTARKISSKGLFFHAGIGSWECQQIVSLAENGLPWLEVWNECTPHSTAGTSGIKAKLLTCSMFILPDLWFCCYDMW